MNIPNRADIRYVYILGTEYRIEVHKISEDDYMREHALSGYCCEEDKIIVIADVSEEQYYQGMSCSAKQRYSNSTLRHEIVHAFLNESGLSDSANVISGSWAKNEEMVDWFAIQSPKIFSVYKDLGILE